jgi:hypothetical protein
MGDVDPTDSQAAIEMQRWEWEGGRVMPVEGRKRAFNEEYANAAAAAAQAGDTNAAREIFSDFAATIDRYSERTWRGSIPWAYVRYIADAFGRVLSGESKSAGHALGIKTSAPGRPVGRHKYHDEEALAAAYWFLVRHGYKPETANKRLSKETGADRRTIQKAAMNKLNLCFGDRGKFDDDELKNAMGPYAVKIEMILAADRKAP